MRPANSPRGQAGVLAFGGPRKGRAGERGWWPEPGSDSCALNPRGDSPHPLSAAHIRLDVLQPLPAERVPNAGGVVAPAPLPHPLLSPAQLHILPGLQGCGWGLAALRVEQQPAAGTPACPPVPLPCFLLCLSGCGPSVVLPLSFSFLASPLPPASPPSLLASRVSLSYLLGHHLLPDPAAGFTVPSILPVTAHAVSPLPPQPPCLPSLSLSLLLELRVVRNRDPPRFYYTELG